MKKTRYTSKQLISLGYIPEINSYPVNLCSPYSRAEIRDLVCGKFKDIIDILYSSSDGSLDNNLSDLVTENSPDSVKQFFHNFLMKPVTPLQGLDNPDDALDLLIPRHLQSHGDLYPFLDKFRNIIETKINDSGHISNE
ncbi:hypothetical protein [Peromfec virus RodF8_12]|uniref:Uncharacterized protein n=1 Tax=Peromfec virus RodF8_12 TaxID=2929358 RepID=A0A976N2R7_9VIRU|nr:hypothetical protein [Peromfec virus RodF8_12]